MDSVKIKPHYNFNYNYVEFTYFSVSYEKYLPLVETGKK